jgi:hypothetical protein
MLAHGSTWKSLRAGKVAWSEKEVDDLSASMYAGLPAAAVTLLSSSTFSGGPVVMLKRGMLATPCVDDIAKNAVWIEPIIRAYAAKVQRVRKYSYERKVSFQRCSQEVLRVGYEKGRRGYESGLYKWRGKALVPFLAEPAFITPSPFFISPTHSCEQRSKETLRSSIFQSN